MTTDDACDTILGGPFDKVQVGVTRSHTERL